MAVAGRAASGSGHVKLPQVIWEFARMSCAWPAAALRMLYSLGPLCWDRAAARVPVGGVLPAGKETDTQESVIQSPQVELWVQVTPQLEFKWRSTPTPRLNARVQFTIGVQTNPPHLH